MRTSPSLNTTRRRALVMTGMIIALVGLLIAFGQNNSSAASQPKASNQTNLGPVINKATTNSFSFNSLAANRLLGLGGMFTSSVSVEANPPAGTPVAVGQTITYVVTLTNDDVTDTAVGAGLNLTVSALVPTGTALIPGSVIVLQQPQGGNTFACQAGTPSCTANKTSTISTFDNFATFKFQYKVTVTAAIGTVLNNTATYVNDGGPATVTSSTISHEVAAPADLGISKFSSPSAVIAGGTSVPFGTPGSGAPAGGTSDIDYELLIANAGPNNATNVIIQDSLPNNTVLVSAPALATATVAVNGVPIPGFVINCGIFPGRFVECRPGDNSGLNAGWTNDVLPSGFSARMRYRVRVPGDVAQGTIIQNEARISSTPTNPGPGTLTADPNTGNNYSTPVNTLVNTLADLGITKVTSNPTPTAGGAAFSYTLTVTNQGLVMRRTLSSTIRYRQASYSRTFLCQTPCRGCIDLRRTTRRHQWGSHLLHKRGLIPT
ncbi:MAG: DUF11 domain-containing protein [Acidobacteria bacterium]|nr:DUF11 domain-containing protein [Acidobacteriota bacterium]